MLTQNNSAANSAEKMQNRDKMVQTKGDFNLMPQDEVVDLWIKGVLDPPPHVVPMVSEYRRLMGVVNECEVSWPRSLDQQMNALYDSMEVFAI